MTRRPAMGSADGCCALAHSVHIYGESCASWTLNCGVDFADWAGRMRRSKHHTVRKTGISAVAVCLGVSLLSVACGGSDEGEEPTAQDPVVAPPVGDAGIVPPAGGAGGTLVPPVAGMVGTEVPDAGVVPVVPVLPEMPPVIPPVTPIEDAGVMPPVGGAGGSVGVPPAGPKASAVALSLTSTCAIYSGKVACAGDLDGAADSANPVLMGGAVDEVFVGLSGGREHLMGLTASGKLFGLGANFDFQAGLGESEDFEVVTFLDGGHVRAGCCLYRRGGR